MTGAHALTPEAGRNEDCRHWDRGRPARRQLEQKNSEQEECVSMKRAGRAVPVEPSVVHTKTQPTNAGVVADRLDRLCLVEWTTSQRRKCGKSTTLPSLQVKDRRGVEWRTVIGRHRHSLSVARRP